MTGESNHSDRGRIGAARASSLVMRNSVWNLLGSGLPILLALVTIPVLIHSIGTERFGVLAIAWITLTYFGLFDLGMGRTTIRFLAEALEHGRFEEGRGLFWTTLILNGMLGVVGASVLLALSPLLTDRILNIPAGIQPEALRAFYLVACSVPLVTILTALRGSLEAQHRFGLLNAIQIPTTSLAQVAPLLVLPFSKDLTWLIGAIVFARSLGTLVFLIFALRQIENPFQGPFFLGDKLRTLFSYGGWLTVSNVIGPLMVYTDRFLIGAFSSMTAVTYYTTPYDAVTRIWILPHSLMRTIFPIFSAEADIRRRTRVYANAIKHLALILAPVIATIVVFAPELLGLWVGESFARNSTLVLQILAIGVFVNSLGLVPFNFIQGVGRPDITAKFHLIEVPSYLLVLWYGLQYWGIVGVAAAWTIRVTVDSLLLFLYMWFTKRLSPVPKKDRLSRTVGSALILIASSWLLFEIVAVSAIKLIVWVFVLGAASYTAWRSLLTSEEREGLLLRCRKAVAWASSKLSASEGGR